jgi:electron transport complex protein RnfD
MYRVILALMPALVWSVIMFGFDAVRVTLLSVAACVGFEFLVQKYLLKTEPKITDGSAVITGILLAFNVPASLPTWMVIAGALIAIGVGKLSFGGLGNNPFNPALVGRVFLLISFRYK